MYCRYCGAPLSDGASFCVNCGQQVTQESAAPEPQKTAVEPVQEDERINAVKEQKKKSILTYAILSLAFGQVALCVVAVCIAGIGNAYGSAVALLSMVVLVAVLPISVFSCVFAYRSARLAKSYEAEYGKINGRGMVGKIMSIPARILSIFTVVYNAAPCLLLFYLMILLW